MESQFAKYKLRNGVPVDVQDQTTRLFDFYFTQTNGTTTTTADTIIDDNEISVASVADISIGDVVSIAHITGDIDTEDLYNGEVLAINALVLTVDSPITFTFESGSPVISRNREMNASGTPESPSLYTLRGPVDPGFVSELDVTRLILEMQCDSSVDLNKFGNIAKLTNGLVLRRNNDIQYNIFNVKDNGDLAILAYDLTMFSATNPSQGIDGLVWRYTFAGQSKHGVAVRLAHGESLEFVIQDDLTDIVKFRCVAAGHVVDPD